MSAGGDRSLAVFGTHMVSALALVALSAAPALGQTVAGGSGHTIIVKPDSTVQSPVSYAQVGGNQQGQWTQQLIRKYDDVDTAAVTALLFIYPYSQAAGLEMGGRICHEPNGKYR